MRECGSVHGNETRVLGAIADPDQHRNWIVLEQGAKRFFAALEICDVDPYADAGLIGRPPILSTRRVHLFEFVGHQPQRTVRPFTIAFGFFVGGAYQRGEDVKVDLAHLPLGSRKLSRE
jgi:hypothetical protein